MHACGLSKAVKTAPDFMRADGYAASLWSMHVLVCVLACLQAIHFSIRDVGIHTKGDAWRQTNGSYLLAISNSLPCKVSNTQCVRLQGLLDALSGVQAARSGTCRGHNGSTHKAVAP